MSTSRELVLHAIKCESSDELLNLLQKQGEKNPSVDVAEVISELGHKQSKEFWKKLAEVLRQLLPALLEGTKKNNNDDKDLNLKVLKTVIGITSVMVSVIQNENVVTSDILPICRSLHDTLASIPNTGNAGIANRIAHLCELWWTKELEGRDSIVSQAMLFLLNRSLENNTKVDVKRVYSLRKCLNDMKLGQLEIDLLLRCVTASAYLNFAEGRKFISHILTLSAQHLMLVHNAIKNELTLCNSQSASYYGEIYCSAWNSANGDLKIKLEIGCIQNLMDICIHASSKRFASILRKVLGYFHNQKNQSDIRKMLVELYEPILWRSLKVANCCVRENSAAIFFDAFPLENPNLNKVESDQALQNQLLIIEELLYDPAPSVRCIAAMGVCRICNIYWEMIPFTVIKSLLMDLVDDLSVDAASSGVRLNVCKGFAHLLENPLAHSFLKDILPQIARCFHDISEKVRVAFVDLLILLKGLKTIKFWKIVPPNELLCRLAVDSAPVARRIVSLLFNTYHPIGKGDEKLLDRSICLITSNRAASRTFYRYSHLYMDINNSVNFMLLVHFLLLAYAKREIKKAVKAGDDEIWVDPTQESDSDREFDDDDDNVKDTNDDICLSTEHIGGLLDAVVVMWLSITSELEKEHNKVFRKKLVVKYSKSMSKFFKVLKNTDAFPSLIYLASMLPSSAVQRAKNQCISSLRAMSSLSSDQNYGIVLECLCNWGRSIDVLDLIMNWLNAGFSCVESPSIEGKSKKKVRQRAVRFKEPNEPQPYLALNFLRYLLNIPQCCNALVNQQRAAMCELLNQLRNGQKLLTSHFSKKENISDSTSELLSSAFIAMCEVAVILHNDEEQPTVDAIEIVSKTLDWIESTALPALDSCKTANRTRSFSAKRDASHLQGFDRMHLLIWNIVETAVSISCNMIITGIMDINFAARIANFCGNLLGKVLSWETDDYHPIVKLLPSVLYTIHYLQEYSLLCKQEGEVIFQSVVPKLLITWLKMMSILDKMEERNNEFFPSMKKPFLQIIQLYQKTALHNLNYFCDIMATLMAAVMTNVTKHIKETSLSLDDITVNSLPCVTSFIILIVRKNSFLWDFISELTKCVVCGAIDDIAWYAAASVVLSFLKISGKSQVEKWNGEILTLENAVRRSQRKVSELHQDEVDLRCQFKKVLEFIKCLKIPVDVPS